nr:DUF3810 domain-containing protein [Kaistella montana]
MFYLFSKTPFFVDKFSTFFEWQKGFHQKLFSSIPFSVGDVFYTILGAALLLFLIKILKKKTRNGYFVKFLVVLNLVYFTYQIFWGQLYFQKPIIDQLPPEEISLEETKSLTLKYLNLCKQTRNLLKEDENGIFKIQNLPLIESEILSNQSQLPTFISSKKSTEINNFKPSLFRKIMSYTEILGYYNPFTAEAQYNAELPSTQIPFTLAHESAHQLGFAREQEANFIGYLLGKNSENVELKYSVEYFVLRSLLNSLVEKNPQFVKQILENYSPAMKRDRIAEKIFAKKHDGFLAIFFDLSNDLFLKSNQQQGSITYSYFVDLMVRYERLNTR